MSPAMGGFSLFALHAGLGSLYRSQHELLPLFKKGSARHVNNADLGRRGCWRSNVWTTPVRRQSFRSLVAKFADGDDAYSIAGRNQRPK
jgi:hypothetical protein